MKVLELKTHKLIEVDDTYGARLIEQGKAILPPVRPSTAPKAEKAIGKKGDAADP